MKERNAGLLLLLTSFIWGMSFVAQSVSSDAVGSFTFNGIRMLIGALVLLPVVIPVARKHKGDKAYWKRAWKSGALLGVLIASASVVQQYGVAISGAGKGGFITSIYIIFVPIFSMLFGSKVSRRTWTCAAAALVGMYMLCISDGFSISSGDLILIACAVLFAFHIIAIDHVGRYTEGVLLSFLQFLIGGAICSVVMIPLEHPSAESIIAVWWPILYAGAFSCGAAYTLQIIGQKYMKPSNAVLILSLESVWAAIGGAIILGESMSAREMIGAALVFASVVAAQIPGKEDSH